MQGVLSGVFQPEVGVLGFQLLHIRAALGKALLLAQKFIGALVGDGQPLRCVQAKGVVVVPMGQHSEIRQRMPLAGQCGVKVLHMGGRVSGIDGQGMPLALDAGQHGPVPLGVVGQIADVRGKGLQFHNGSCSKNKKRAAPRQVGVWGSPHPFDVIELRTKAA